MNYTRRVSFQNIYTTSAAQNQYDLRRPNRLDVQEHLSILCNQLAEALPAELTSTVPNGATSKHVSTRLALIALCQCSLESMSGFLEKMQLFYQLYQERMFDPRRTSLTKDSTGQVISNAHFYAQLDECVSALTSATLPLLDLLHIDYPTSPDLKYLAAETQAVCADLSRGSARFRSRLDNNVRLFEIKRGYKDSKRARHIGLLAVVFLPLSLASGLLSMQTRLADLHYLLYDFCGVIVLLGTIVIILAALLSMFTQLNEKLVQAKDDPEIPSWVVSSLQANVYGWSSLLWGLLLSSFMVGMIRSVTLGTKILVYGVAAIGGLLLVLGLGAATMWRLHKWFAALTM